MDNKLTIVENMDLQGLSGTMGKITQFQGIVQKQLRKDHDYGIIPGTQKPSLLKPGAEKILMLMGLRSEFSLVDSTRDFEKGFFQYMVKCSLFHNDNLITEGMGSCNNLEGKFKKQDPFSIDNTILKMAKKRALLDAALLVGSLSDIFTQDFDEEDINGDSINQKKVFTDQDGTISKAQAKRMYAIANGDVELIKGILKEFGYEKSEEVAKTDYDKICIRIEEMTNK